MSLGIKLVSRKDGERAFQLITYCFPWFNEVKEKARELIDDFVSKDVILGYYDERGILNAMIAILPFDIYIYGSPLGNGWYWHCIFYARRKNTEAKWQGCFKKFSPDYEG